jgi:hypothetical protein
LKLFQELGERTKKLEAEIGLYRDMAIRLATLKGVEVPDFVKDGSAGLGEGQDDKLLEWLEHLVAGEETATTTTTTTTTRGRTSSRKRGKYGSGTSRGKRSGGGGGEDDAAVA